MTSIKDIKIAVIGAGNIGAAMARGLAKAGEHVALYNRSEGRLAAFADTPGIERCTTDIREAAAGASIVVICVEGDAVETVIGMMGTELTAYNPIVVSCAAAPTLEMLAEWVAPYMTEPRIARVLPNIAATVGESVNLVCSRGLDPAQADRLCELFDATGRSYVVPERLFGPAMAISSCGIANALRYVRATMEAGVELGLTPTLARDLAAGAMAGAAAMLAATGAHPEALVDSVTTPGGLTIRGLNAMEASGFSASVIAGVKAASKRN